MATVILTSTVHNAHRKHIEIPAGYTLVRHGNIIAEDMILNFLSKRFENVSEGSEYIGDPVDDCVVVRKDKICDATGNPSDFLKEVITVEVNIDEDTKFVTYIHKLGMEVSEPF